jgi:Protein of unknown function (DUF998)
MTMLAIAAAVLAVAWAVLVVVAQVLNPDQSPLSMGMSGLARGRVPWVMKSSFLARGLSALLLIAALPGQLALAGWVLPGVVLFWVWGVGSAALALADTDMPGEPPSSAGAAHALIAMVAYIAGAAGAIVLSFTMLRDEAISGVATWALPVSIAAAVALVVQFVAFGAAAREARAAAPLAVAVAAPVAARKPPVWDAVAAAPAPAIARQLASVPPQLGARAAADVRPARRPADATKAALQRLAGYAGLFQRVFVGLLMAWTLLVALGLAF